jgi:hypothetical protein
MFHDIVVIMLTFFSHLYYKGEEALHKDVKQIYRR